MIEIKDLLGLNKPLTRLIEVISSGVGAVCMPYLIKKNSKAEAYKIQVIAEALKNAEDKYNVQAIYKDSVLETWHNSNDRSMILDSLSTSQVRAELRTDYQERKRQHNLENITSTAANELSKIDEISDEKPDADWIARFFNSAQDISSEQMQFLWGRILAGEIQKPGSFSLKTLDLIRNITESEAKNLELVAKFTIQHGDLTFIPIHDRKLLENHKIYDATQVALTELGAIYPTELSLTIFPDGATQEIVKDEILVASESLLIISKGETKKAVSFPLWKFTTIGKELLALIPKPNNDEYLESLGLFISKQKATVKIAKIIERLPNEKFNCDNPRQIETE